MTEQERFEQEAEKHFIAENLTGSAFLKDRFGEYMHPQINWGWHCWQAAQQKEGYVLVPVESVQEVLSWLDDNSDAFEYAGSSHVRECIKHRDILQQAIEAAQEAE